MEIIWTDRAYYSYDNNIDYLLNEWSLEVVRNFIGKTEEAEKLLLENPHLGRFDEDLNLYKLLVVKQIYLFYEIHGNHVVMIDFWNNYKKP
ncbi:MAG: type II toxin-antitoxin system RelE/ParE family toxin [Aequorivita sp.]